jgi:hypothetical protein
MSTTVAPRVWVVALICILPVLEPFPPDPRISRHLDFSTVENAEESVLALEIMGGNQSKLIAQARKQNEKATVANFLVVSNPKNVNLFSLFLRNG